MTGPVAANKPAMPPADAQSVDQGETNCLRAMVDSAMQYLSETLSTAGKAILPDPIAEPSVISPERRSRLTAGPSVDDGPSAWDGKLEAERKGFIE